MRAAYRGPSSHGMRAGRFLLESPAELGRPDAKLAVLEPSEYAVGWNPGPNGSGARARNAAGVTLGGWRTRRPRVDRAARVGPRRQSVLRVGSDRLVEPLPGR